ncbi:MAG: hypothetical protein LBG72_10170 [Spirochaetaceae bacterium]|nr:hypothetical protein [Spirochaetaceae bacterium]
MVADATGAGNTTIKIKYKAGGIDFNKVMSSPKQNAVVSDIPLPTDGSDVEIQFECGIGSWGDGEAKDTITVKVTTPTPTLENLSVRYTSEKTDDSKELIKYSKTQADYTITAKQTDNNVTIKPEITEGQEMTVTLKGGNSAADSPLTANGDGAYEAAPDQPGGYSKTVEIKVKFKDKENVYNVTIAAPKSNNPVGYNLTNLKVSYIPNVETGNELTDAKAFTSTNHKYTLSPNVGDSNVGANIYFAAESEQGSTITATYTGLEGTIPGSGFTSISGNVAMPDDITGQRTLKFKVARADGNNAEWSVAINPPSDITSWTGTVTYPAGYNIQPGLVLKDENGNFQSGLLIPSTGSPASFTMEAPNNYEPVTALVQFTNGEGRRMQSIPLPVSVTGSTAAITIDNIDKLTYIIDSANSFYSTLNDAANRTVNYSLMNDINLNDFTDAGGNPKAWRGPSGYQGHFYGNGYTIKNLVLSVASGECGLFGSLGNGAVIEDFILEVSTANSIKNGNVGSLYFGGVLGMINTSPIDMSITAKKIKVQGSLEFNNHNGTHIVIGGFFGGVNTINKSVNVTIENCASELDIKLNGANGEPLPQTTTFGGFMGIARGTVTIKNSYSKGNIDITQNIDKYSSAGAFLGSLGGIEGSGGTHTVVIENCYAQGNVINKSTRAVWSTGRELSAGGFVGGVRTGANLTIHNSIALTEKVLTIAGAGADTTLVKNGRILGGLNNSGGSSGGFWVTQSYSNVLARSGMITGTAEPGTANTTPGSATTIEGKAVDPSNFTNAAFWTNAAQADGSGGLGWSAAIWDFSTVPALGRPVLK